MEITTKQKENIKRKLIDRLNTYYGDDTAQYERLRISIPREVENEYIKVFNIKSDIRYFS